MTLTSNRGNMADFSVLFFGAALVLLFHYISLTRIGL